jgi:hypothetical protein
VRIEPGPGAKPFSSELLTQLERAVAARGRYRTRHKREDGTPLFTNRLALETSPYLLQHAHNPVDWRPWGAAAFAEAKALDKPLFLSVGYATCHWCHVMEEESFESEEIARLLNEHFVPVKVDREERPDVDAIYMQAVQMLTQHGGWPMTVVMTPEARPFFGGTYFPALDGQRGARYGLRTVLLELSRIWREERQRAEAGAVQLAQAVQQQLSAESPAGTPTEQVVRDALEYYAQVFDHQEGGVRRAPKFPSSLNLRFLLRAWKRLGEEDALKMADLTLRKMALGGIYDQVGGGFHRYSTDARWLVPHFEKMLYDNALLVCAYVEGWQATGDPFYRRVACETLDYVASEMTSESGAFHSATDADSEGEEGTFFVWTLPEMRKLLGDEDGDRAARLFGVSEGGNFEGKNVLSLAAVPDDWQFVEKVRKALYAVRSRRPPPLTDTKVLTSWNGLMISGFARAGLAFSRKNYVERATAAASALLRDHFAGEILLRTGRHPGLLEDHSFFAAGLLDLYEATGDARWLRESVRLHEILEARFADGNGGYFRTPDGGEVLLAREKPAYDGAEPTGNSVAALTLLRLSAITGEDRFRAQGEALLRSFGALLSSAPAALGEMLLAVDFALGEPREVVLVRPASGSDDVLLDALRPRFAPSQVLVRHVEGAEPATALARDRPTLDGKPTAYVCTRGACQLPVTEGSALIATLGNAPAAIAS